MAADYRKIQDESVRLLDADDYEHAEPLARQALTLAQKLFGKTHAEVADCTHNLAVLHRARGENAKALAMFERALALEEALGEPRREDLARTLGDIANLIVRSQKFERARPIAERAAIAMKACGVCDHDLAFALNDAALCAYQAGDMEAARTASEEAIAVFERNGAHTDATEATELLVKVNARTGCDAFDRGDIATASKVFGEALVLAETLGESIELVNALVNVSAAAAAEEDVERAASTAQRAVDLGRKLGVDDVLANALYRRACAHALAGEDAQAIPLAERAIEMYRRHKETARLIFAMRLLGDSQNEIEATRDACRTFVEMRKIVRRHFGDDSLDLTVVEEQLAHCYSDLEDDRAGALYRRVLAARERLAPASEDLAFALNNLALWLSDIEGSEDEATALAKRAIDVATEALGPQGDTTAECWDTFARTRVATEDFAGADDAFMRAFEIREESGDARETVEEAVDALGDNLHRCPRVEAYVRRHEVGSTS